MWRGSIPGVPMRLERVSDTCTQTANWEGRAQLRHIAIGELRRRAERSRDPPYVRDGLRVVDERGLELDEQVGQLLGTSLGVHCPGLVRSQSRGHQIAGEPRELGDLGDSGVR